MWCVFKDAASTGMLLQGCVDGTEPKQMYPCPLWIGSSSCYVWTLPHRMLLKCSETEMRSDFTCRVIRGPVCGSNTGPFLLGRVVIPQGVVSMGRRPRSLEKSLQILGYGQNLWAKPLPRKANSDSRMREDLCTEFLCCFLWLGVSRAQVIKIYY